MKIYIILHLEVMGTPSNLRMDEMVFYTTSSLKRALAIIKGGKRKLRVSKWSYWQVQVQKLNVPEWPEHVGYYGRTGKKIKHPCYSKYEKRFLNHLKSE